MEYITDILDPREIIVPRGYRSDFATIPWYARSFLPPSGLWREAAVVHDYLCHPRNTLGFPILRICSHEEASLVFEEAMLDCNVGPKVAALMAWSVRRGGPHFEAGDDWTPQIEYSIEPSNA